MSTDPDLAGRIFRYDPDTGEDAMFIDTIIPGFERTIWSVVGSNVYERRDDRHPIPADGFHIGLLRCEPGKGGGLHTHTTVEVFTPLSGRWEMRTGADSQFSTILGPYDTLSVPPGVWRSFRNVSDETAHLFVIVGGQDAGRLTWAPDVLAAAAQRGKTLDDQGFMADESR